MVRNATPLKTNIPLIDSTLNSNSKIKTYGFIYNFLATQDLKSGVLNLLLRA